MGSNEIVPISQGVREELKHPLGVLIADEDLSAVSIAEYFKNSKALTVCIGDRTTERVHEFGFSPRLEIVDSIEKRKPRKALKIFDSSRIVLKTNNPPGSISYEALHTLKESLFSIQGSSDKKIRIVVNGEEDLLALPVIAFFPDHTFTFYGQPSVGMVVVDSSAGRGRSKLILGEMGIRSLS